MKLETGIPIGKIKNRVKKVSGFHENQSGVALVMVLLVLVILSFMGLSGLLSFPLFLPLFISPTVKHGQ